MDLLIFRYKGGSILVLIFDPHRTCQINHSIRRTYDTINDVESDDCVEIPNAEVLPKKRKTDTNRNGRTKDSTSQRTKFGKRKINVGFDAPQQRGTSRGCSKAEGTLKQESRGYSKAEATLKQKETPVERAGNFQTKIKNPSFICSLSRSYIQRDNLVIPIMFSKEYLNGYKGDATIGVSEDRTLLVKIRINNRNNQSSIYNGWNSFCKENKLEVGDTCVFEKTEWTSVSFKIHIFRARENPEELQGYGHEANRQNQDQRHKRPIQNMERRKRKRSEGISRSCPKTDVLEDSECPNMDENKFKLCINSIHLQNGYPFSFAVHTARVSEEPSYMCHGKDVTLQVGEMLWPVKVVYYNYPNRAFGRFSGGWVEFARGCKLKVGNICEFDLIDEEKLVFTVSIS